MAQAVEVEDILHEVLSATVILEVAAELRRGSEEQLLGGLRLQRRHAEPGRPRPRLGRIHPRLREVGGGPRRGDVDPDAGLSAITGEEPDVGDLGERHVDERVDRNLGLRQPVSERRKRVEDLPGIDPLEVDVDAGSPRRPQEPAL